MITLELDEATIRIAKSVLRDALAEFRSARMPVRAYVEKRHSYLSAADKIKKCNEVQNRIDIANELLKQVFNLPE